VNEILGRLLWNVRARNCISRLIWNNRIKSEIMMTPQNALLPSPMPMSSLCSVTLKHTTIFRYSETTDRNVGICTLQWNLYNTEILRYVNIKITYFLVLLKAFHCCKVANVFLIQCLTYPLDHLPSHHQSASGLPCP